MAFTVRELSAQAETNLKRLLDNNKSVLKTKTKAIDYVLSNYYRNEAHIKALEEKQDDSQKKYIEVYEELQELKNSLKFIFDSIKK